MPYLVLARVFTADRALLFFPDYRLSGSAQIPFRAHQTADIHLKDDICGEFLNNRIVIQHGVGGQGGGGL